MKLSVIVPIYKVEQYLDKCVQSLLAQDMPVSEYEIILVDDGSLDNCPKMCDEYAANYPNIQVIHRTNGGLSAARNSGMKMATGDYIQFVDSDDFLEPNVIGGLVAQMDREKLDVLRFNYQNVNPDYNVFWPYKSAKFVDQSTDIIGGERYLNERLGYGCYAWQFILKRELLNDCLFTEGIHFEDTDWTPRLLLKAKRVNATTTIAYNYLLRSESITGAKTIDAKRKNIEDYFLVINGLNILLKQHPSCDWTKRMRSTMVSSMLTNVAIYFYDDKDMYINQLKSLSVLPLSSNISNRTYLRRARLINFSPLLFCYLMHLIKKT